MTLQQWWRWGQFLDGVGDERYPIIEPNTETSARVGDAD